MGCIYGDNLTGVPKSLYVINTHYCQRRIMNTRGVMRGGFQFQSVTTLYKGTISISRWCEATEETFWGLPSLPAFILFQIEVQKFQLNGLPVKCSGPRQHAFNPGVNLIWSRERHKGKTHWLIKPSQVGMGCEGINEMKKSVKKESDAGEEEKKHKKERKQE